MDSCHGIIILLTHVLLLCLTVDSFVVCFVYSASIHAYKCDLLTVINPSARSLVRYSAKLKLGSGFKLISQAVGSNVGSDMFMHILPPTQVLFYYIHSLCVLIWI